VRNAEQTLLSCESFDSDYGLCNLQAPYYKALSSRPRIADSLAQEGQRRNENADDDDPVRRAIGNRTGSKEQINLLL
jgi:hypothetical protein